MRNRRYRDGVDGGILDDDRLRIILLGIFFLLVFIAVAACLYFVQVHHGEEHRRQIARQSERRVRLPGLRGSIYSADNRLLAGNQLAYDLLFFPAEMHLGGRIRTAAYMNNCAAVLASAMGRTEFPSAKQFARHLMISPAVPMTVFKNLSPQECARAFEAAREMKGVDIQSSPIRVYPCGDSASHIIGFARKADVSKADDRKDFRRYYNPDLEGKDGVEKAFDTLDQADASLGLRAFPGRSVIQVNNIGYSHRELLGRSEPIHGSDVILTIDSRAQLIAEDLLKDHVGAIVVLDADNGNIICAASSPRMDIGRLTEYDYYQSLNKNPDKPFLHRAFQAEYQPGSTIKPLVCMAFLNAGIDPEKEIFCEGKIPVGSRDIRCSAHRYAAADMNMITALEKSCNSYMIHNAISVGRENLAKMMASAGFGRKTGVQLGEASGKLPTEELKLQRDRTRWNIYDTALISIGQGMIAVTPLQMAVYTAAIANGGTVWQANLLKEIRDSRQVVRFRQKPVAAGKLDISPENLEIIRKGMFQVVNSSGGSGRRGAVEGLTVYGKTGTAETGTRGNIRNITHFIAFTTYKGRTYALSVTIEDGLSGGRTCAPLAAAFFNHYLFP